MSTPVVSDIGSFLKGFSSAQGGFWSLGLNALLNNLVSLLVVAAMVVVFIVLILGGIKWVTSKGDKEALSSAQKTLTAGIIGLVIVLAAWAIVNLVKTFLGISGVPELPGGPSP